MKVIFQLILLFPFTIIAQIELHNISLTDSSLKLLYISANNQIEISGLNNNENLKLISANGKIHFFDDKFNCFYVNVNMKGKDTLKLYQNDILISSSIFECRGLPNPIPILGNSTDTILTVDEILKDPTLNAILPDCYLKPYFFIVSYQIFFWRHRNGRVIRNLDKSDYKIKLNYKKFNDSIEEISIKYFRDTIYYYDQNNSYELEKTKIIKGRFEDINYGGPLKNYQIHIIKQLKTGDQIIFEDIKCRCVGCTTRNLGTLIITIK